MRTVWHPLIAVGLVVSQSGCGALATILVQREPVREARKKEVTIRTEPPGAEVLIDRGDELELVGRSPVDVEVPYERRTRLTGSLTTLWLLGTAIDASLAAVTATQVDWSMNSRSSQEALLDGDDEPTDPMLYAFSFFAAAVIVDLIYIARVEDDDVPQSLDVVVRDDQGRWDDAKILVPETSRVTLRPSAASTRTRLERDRADDRDFKAAKAAGTQEALKAYLKAHPAGRHAAEAQQLLRDSVVPVLPLDLETITSTAAP